MHPTLTDTEMALAEALHRARNDLQAVVSMLRLQANVSINPGVRAALNDAEARVTALASLNAKLDAAAEGAGKRFDSAAFIEGLATDLQAMHFGQRMITLVIDAESCSLDAGQGKPLGLILNELVVNALKYAFPGEEQGTVRIAFRRDGPDYVLSVADNGIGVDIAAPPRGTGLGTRLVRGLTRQIGGQFHIVRAAAGGTECTIRWPAPS